MHFLIILIIFSLPILYIIGEVKDKKLLRIIAFILLMPLCMLIAYFIGQVARLYYNANYGVITKKLIDESIVQLENGNTNHTIKCFKILSKKYRPTYESKANYKKLVEETVKKMRKNK